MDLVGIQEVRCDITVLDAHSPTEDKIDDEMDSFHKEPGCVFNKFPKYHMIILL
jgi:hypothetical protein